MKDRLLNIKNEAISLIISAQDQKELEEIRIQFLGRNGTLTLAMKQITNVSKEEKPQMGKIINEIKQIIEDALTGKINTFNSQPKDKEEKLDVTEPGIRPSLGHLHLVTQAIETISEIFRPLGFVRVRYPEIEWDYYAFTSLNFPENHPARDDWETFFTTDKTHPQKGSIILTPHTSSGQVRELEKAVADNKKTGKPIDIKMLNIAKCYRRQSDISHTQMFHQFEGLVVGENIAITHLKGVLDYFVKSYFGEKRASRIRPYHFQFTEPSFEVDVSCGVCLGTGCKLCKEGWL